MCCSATVPPAARLAFRVVAGSAPLEDREDLAHLLVGQPAAIDRGPPIGRALGWRIDLAEARTILRRRVLERPDHRQRLLPLADVPGLGLARVLRAPERALDVIGHLEGHAEVVPELPIRLVDLGVVDGQDRAGHDRGAEQCGGLLADHLVVRLDGHVVAALEADVEILPFAEREARLVVDLHQVEDASILVFLALEEPVQGEPAQREERVAGVDRGRDAPQGPERGPMTALAVGVLDVVVDEAEVVPELERSGAGQGLLVVPAEGLVGEEAEERTDSLPAPLRGVGIEPEVVGEHLVQRPGRAGSLVQDVRHLGLDVGQDLRKLGPDVHRGRVPDLLDQSCHAENDTPM